VSSNTSTLLASTPVLTNQLAMNPLLKQSLSHWLWTVFTTAVFGLTAAFVRTSISADSYFFRGSFTFKGFSSTLAILRFLQETTSTLTGFSLHQTLELIQWSLLSQGDGMRLLTFLSICPATGFLGMLWMIVVIKSPKACDRAWAGCR
jgi:hypothetical protein